MEQLAKIFRGRFGDAINVLGNWRHLLGYPGGRISGARHEGVAEHAGGAGEDKRPDAFPCSLFQQIERARDIDIDEILLAMRSDVRFMQRGGV